MSNHPPRPPGSEAHNGGRLRAVAELMREATAQFEDRVHAARLLAEKLSRYRGSNPLILGVPRGAVPMAEVIAEALGGDLDVVLVRKLGAPGQPELAIGAVDETGQTYLHRYFGVLGVSEAYLQTEIEEQLQVLQRRRQAYTPYRPPINPVGRIVIVVDDGCATGATLKAGLRCVRAQEPAKLVAAVAVASSSALELLGAEADEVVCLKVPEPFYAVGEYFRDFSPVSDAQVTEILRRSGSRVAKAG